MKPTNTIYTGLPTTIFETMSRLAAQHGAINLGQGFPDVDGPLDIRHNASDELLNGYNQYPPMLGLPALRTAVADANKRFYDLDIDANSQVLVTSGATEALSDCLTALIEPGDEIILIEPLYDCYLPLAQRAGAVVKSVRVVPPNWTLDRDALEQAFSDNTKAVLLNNPHNPAGKVFSREELGWIADLLIKYDAYAICDEVYEHITFDGRSHIPLMTLDGMAERCLRIGSAGKTFSLTGWKVGYVTGPASLLDPVAKAHQFTTFTTPPNLQSAVAFGLSKGDNYYNALAADLQAKRDRLAKGLAAVGLDVIPCEGTYFLTTDITAVCLRIDSALDDVAFCQMMTEQAKVTAVPVSAFYVKDNQSEVPKNFIRFCFSKKDAVLDDAVKRLLKWVQA
ncbi:aminotransferase [Cohaesibacter celericrescens]|uniref:Aminotransferase n=1 Tax=Cohaesibacter celericrescens TaxID=2067669 RepID=A0A2N5XR74_9HYPH|nr:aminotransferase [Cohaesibacter celericrescens]PLW77022.1 aminotransferase [Cohaesibacter celericrescens]